MAIATCRYTANSDGTPGSHHQNDPDLAVVFVESGRGCKLSSQFLSLCKSTTSPLNINFSPENKQTNKQTDRQKIPETQHAAYTPLVPPLSRPAFQVQKNKPYKNPNFLHNYSMACPTIQWVNVSMPSPLKPCHRSHVHTDPSIQDHL